MNVFLQYGLLIIFEILHLIQDKNTSSSTKIRGLANPNAVLVAIFVIIADELFVFVRHNECQWRKVIDLSIQLFGFLYQSGQVVFRAN